MLRNVSPIALLLLCAALPSCGGGGGGGGTPPPAPVPAPTPAPTPTPPPPPAIPPLAQPPIDISGEGAVVGTPSPNWPAGDTPSGGQGNPVDGIPCGAPIETYHIHSHLTVAVNGQLVAVPGPVGILPPNGTFAGCTYQIHTHDFSGRLHVEAPAAVNYTLGNFFHIWGQTLAADNVGGITGMPIVIFITESDGTTTIYSGDPNAIELTPHRLITFQIGTPLTQIPNFTWSPN